MRELDRQPAHEKEAGKREPSENLARRVSHPITLPIDFAWQAVEKLCGHA